MRFEINPNVNDAQTNIPPPVALKAKLAKYRAQLLEPDKKAGGKGEGFDVLKSGGMSPA
jgi:ribosome-interacting GTPase 1